MPGKIFVCKHCKIGYFKNKIPPENLNCEKCETTILEELEDWEEFVCPTCKKRYETLSLQMMGDAQTLEPGIVKCTIDKTELKWEPYEDHEGILEQEFELDEEAWDEVLQQKFEEEKHLEQQRESAILQALSFKPKRERERKRRYYNFSESILASKSTESVSEPITTILEETTEPIAEKLEAAAPLSKTAADSSAFDRFLKVTEKITPNVIQKPSPLSATSSKPGIATPPTPKPIVELQSSTASSKPVFTPKQVQSTSAPSGDVEIAEISKSELEEDISIEQPIIPEIPEELSEAELAKMASEADESVTLPPIIETEFAITEITANLPFAEEFWDYYFIQHNITDSNQYLGGEAAADKILGLLEEVNNHFLSYNKIDISRPIFDKMTEGKVYIVGDTHGSIKDTDMLIKYFVQLIEDQEATGKSNALRIIFDGDYVDRNPMDIHNVCYIFAFALKYAKYVRLLRGNHEEMMINTNYGFRQNLISHFPKGKLFEPFQKTYANLPLMHVLRGNGKSILTLHGGLPIYDYEFEEMPDIPNLVGGGDPMDSRFTNIEEMDELSQQILWNDPANDLPPNSYFLPSRRGIGFNFGEKVFDKWMEVNGVDRLVRAHEVFLEGHHEYFNNRLFSLFSASDYAGRKIQAKIIEFDLDKDWESNWKHYTILKDIEPLLKVK